MTSRLVEGALDPTELLRGTEDPASGALVVVTAGADEGELAASAGRAGTGTAGSRGNGGRAGDRGVEGVLADLEAEAVERFDVRRCRFRVRAGAPRDGPAVAAVVRAPHRGAAFDAGRWAVSSALERLDAPPADGP